MNKSFYSQSSFKKSMTYSQCLALESRMVFDGAGVATAVDAQQTISDQPSANSVSVASVQPSEPIASFLPENIPQTIDYSPHVDTANNQAQFFIAPDVSNSIDTSVVTGANTGQTTAIFIVDPRTEEAALLSLTPPVNAQVIILDPARDGFLQVTEQLQNRHDVTELHIIPWTKDNQQWLGSQSVSATLEPAVSNNLIAWDNALVDNAKLVFHGQNSMDASWLDHVGAITTTQTSWLLDSKTDSLSSEQAKTVIFIDSAVQNVADIISSIDTSTEIVYLDATKDGLTQIADYLDGRTGIDSLQIISHANQGTLQLGNEILTNDNLADYADQLATIGHSLTLNGDILFYGCDLAKSTEGSQFVDSFSYLTQADVAASTDITGAASKGGNWTLEYTTGTIEASILAASHYQDILALPTFDVAGGALIFGGDPAIAGDVLVHPVTVVKGTGRATGDIILFGNVITINGQSIDAVVTIVDLSSGNAAISAIDSTPVPPPSPPNIGLSNPLNPHWFELDTASANDPVTGLPTNGALTIKFEFILNGTYIPATGSGTDVLLQNVTVNSYDIDNGQFQDFSGFSSYSVSNNTTLVVTTPDGFTHFADNIPNSLNSADPNIPAQLPTFNQARVTAIYKEINTFQLKVGSTNTDVAFFYLDFSQTYGAITPSLTFNVPTAVNDTGTGNTGIPVIVDVTTNDSDPDINSPLNPASVQIVAPTAVDGSKIVPGQGTWTVVLDPTTGRDFIKFTPFIGFTGNPTPISYTVKDTSGLESNAATVTVTYPPIVRPDTATGITGSPVTLPVLGNDGDTGVILNPASVKIAGTATAGASLDVPNEGTWTVNTTTGAITFTPIAGFVGSPTPIQYTVKDTGGLESVIPATVTVNYPPIARPDTVTGVGGNPVIVTILGNDGGTNVTLNPASVQIVGTAIAGAPLVVPNEGTWTVDSTTGAITFTPIAGFVGSPTPIQYTVKDAGGLVSGQATVTVNNPPIANNDIATGSSGNPIIVNILGNDGGLGINLDPASVQIIGATTQGAPLVVPNEGTWTVDSTTGTITFTPIAGFVGNPTPIQYTVKDTGGLVSTPAIVTVIMKNSLPLANPDRNSASVGGSAVTGDLIINDQQGAIPTFVTSASQGTNPIIIGSAFTTAAGGVLILNTDGSYSYIPPSNVASIGLTEQFNYTITDSNGNSSSSILTIVVTPATSGSLIQLSNPPVFFSNDRSIFFVAKPLETVKVSNLGLYIPSANDIISLTGSLRDQVVLELKHFSFDIPSWSFRHTNPNAQLEFEATRPDGSALPRWLQFNPKLLRFSGVPPKGAYHEEVMVTARDSYGNEIHTIFYVHVNKESVRPEHKSLAVDLKLMGLSSKVLEKNTHKEKVVAKPALSERMNKIGKMGKLQESRALLDSLKAR